MDSETNSSIISPIFETSDLPYGVNLCLANFTFTLTSAESFKSTKFDLDKLYKYIEPSEDCILTASLGSQKKTITSLKDSLKKKRIGFYNCIILTVKGESRNHGLKIFKNGTGSILTCMSHKELEHVRNFLLELLSKAGIGDFILKSYKPSLMIYDLKLKQKIDFENFFEKIKCTESYTLYLSNIKSFTLNDTRMVSIGTKQFRFFNPKNKEILLKCYKDILDILNLSKEDICIKKTNICNEEEEYPELPMESLSLEEEVFI